MLLLLTVVSVFCSSSLFLQLPKLEQQWPLPPLWSTVSSCKPLVHTSCLELPSASHPCHRASVTLMDSTAMPSQMVSQLLSLFYHFSNLNFRNHNSNVSSTQVNNKRKVKGGCSMLLQWEIVKGTYPTLSIRMSTQQYLLVSNICQVLCPDIDIQSQVSFL